MHNDNIEYYLERSGVMVSELRQCLKSLAQKDMAYQNAIEDQDNYVIDGIEATISYCLNILLKTEIDAIHLRQFINIYHKAKPGNLIKLDKKYWIVKPKMPKVAEFKNEINE